MEKKEMTFYKMRMAGDGDSTDIKLFNLIYDWISFNNKIDITFRTNDHYILIFDECRVIKQIKKKRVNMKSSEIKEE